MVDKILIPVDFSQQSYHALKFVYQMNAEIDAKLVMVHLQDKYSHKVKAPATDAILEKLANNAFEGAFTELIYRLQKDTNQTIELDHHHKERSGNSFAHDVVSFADELGVDLIVMGTHGANSIRDYILGSNTTNVMDHSDIPVLAIPKEAEYDGDIDDIVVGIKFQEFPHKAFESVLFLAKAFKSRLVCLDVNIAHNPYLDSLKNKLIQHYSEDQVYFEIVDAMDVSDAIIEWSKQNNVDFIVMHAVKRSGLSKIFNRSYTEELVFHSKIPVMAV